MSVSAIGSAAPSAPPAPVPAPDARVAGGDYAKANASTSQVKDSDGDYKPVSASPAGSSSSAVQAALNGLQTGGS
ncbi:MAG: hypothetical protein ABR970_21290 [Roseiarcus sp.]|jgi:hypothetical protein